MVLLVHHGHRLDPTAIPRLGAVPRLHADLDYLRLLRYRLRHHNDRRLLGPAAVSTTSGPYEALLAAPAARCLKEILSERLPGGPDLGCLSPSRVVFLPLPLPLSLPLSLSSFSGSFSL